SGAKRAQNLLGRALTTAQELGLANVVAEARPPPAGTLTERRVGRSRASGSRPGTLGGVPQRRYALRGLRSPQRPARSSSAAARDFGCQLGAVGQVELDVDVVQVDLGGPGRDEELGPDLGVAQAFGGEA